MICVRRGFMVLPFFVELSGGHYCKMAGFGGKDAEQPFERITSACGGSGFANVRYFYERMTIVFRG